MSKIVLPAEWAPQSAVMLAWPHSDTDWADMLHEVKDCFSEIIHAISRHQDVLLLVHDDAELKAVEGTFNNRVHCVITPTNDTWARDFGPIFISKDNKPVLLDFKFNGWGLKFGADKDNLISGNLFRQGIFSQQVEYVNRLNFVLEGGSLESDGLGTLLTTSECLLSPNRNGEWNRTQIETYLKENLGFKRVLWVNNGYLAGDDTDSHIDTLARLCDAETIAYVKCDDANDEHFEALLKMEQELKEFVTDKGKPYKLVPLPMAQPVYDGNDRLPATYANFLIINGAVLVPTYNSPLDKIALAQLAPAFPNREIIGIDCSALIKQHGSLHCVTMQMPEGVLK
jgi:agmatine/peptidylarginine deiminase